MGSHSGYSVAEILKGFKAGEARVINDFYRQLRTKAFAVLLALNPNDAIAHYALEEAFSKGFLILRQKLLGEQFVSGNLMAYAIEIIKRCFWEEQKRFKRNHWSELDEALGVPVMDDTLVGSLFEFIHKQDDPLLYRWYHQLEDEEKQLIDLRIKDYSYREIAQKMSFSEGTLRNQYMRLIKKARKTIKTKKVFNTILV